MHKKSSSYYLKLCTHRRRADQSVLGGLMLDNDRWDEVAPLLQAEDFVPERIRKSEENGRPVSDKQPDRLITLSDVLEKDGVLERVGALLIWAELSKNTPSAWPLSAMRRLSWIAAVPVV